VGDASEKGDVSLPRETVPAKRSGWFGGRWYYLGPFLAVYAWAVILVSAWVNSPWWVWTGSALSFLGSPGATDPWIYDYVGMVPVGILVAVFSLYLFQASRNRVQKLGSAFLFLGGVLLVLVGIFHETNGGPGYENLHVLFSGWFFLQLFLTALTWGIGLAWEGRHRLAQLGATMAALSIGAVVVFIILSLLAHFSKYDLLPGATGEVLGVLVFDVWIALMYFARSEYSFNERPTPTVPFTTPVPGETPWISTRPSILHAVQIRALIYVAAGMLLFYFGYYNLSSNLVNIIIGSVSVINVAIVTVLSLVIGYALVVIGARRWLSVLPRHVGHVLLSLIIVVPLIFVATWFSSSGNSIMLGFFLVLGALVPLNLSLVLWWRTTYALTDRRVLSTLDSSTMTPETLRAEEARVVSMDQGFVQWLAGVGDITFAADPYSLSAVAAGAQELVEWKGVVNPQSAVEMARMTSCMVTGPHRRRRHVGFFVVAITVVAAVALILTLVPVYSVTNYVNLPCGLWVSAENIKNDPWPYVHNVTVPIGNVSLTWWSGSPLWFLIIQLPKGISYQNTVLQSLYPQNQSSLTSNGTGTFTSYGGSFLMMCVATNSETSVTLKLSYSAPLIWES
jgi:hypothetical membrane protein